MQGGKALIDLNETQPDGSAPYSRSNPHGPKRRDFAVSRVQARERIHQRVQKAIAEEREYARRQTEIQRTAALKLSAEIAEAPQPRLAVLQETAQRLHADSTTASAQETAPPSAQQNRAAAQAMPLSAWWPLPPSREASPPELLAWPSEGRPQPKFRPEDGSSYARRAIAPTEDPWRPAWLASGRMEGSSLPVPPVPADTLQGARDRLTSRWFALKGVFEGMSASEVSAAQAGVPAPVLAIFSLAGGVGKTCMVATLGRALSACGERVLLVETAAYGLLPFFFGARDQRPGVLRTFSPPAARSDAPVQMVTIDSDALARETDTEEPLSAEIAECAQNTSRVIVDIATASAATVRRVLHLVPLVLVPVVPDMNSVVSAGSIDSFFQRHCDGERRPAQIYYVLNQFDSSLPLHLDVREVLRERLGDRLLPFALRRAPAVSEALAEGMTVMDYAPDSPIAEDFSALAAWVKSLSESTGAPCRGMRWSERQG